MTGRVVTLGSLNLQTPDTQIFEAVDGFDGANAVTLEIQFNYQSGGTTCVVKVQTSFDGGSNWRDVARADFALVSRIVHCNLQALAAKGITAYADLNAEGVNDGILGDQFRTVISWTGTYVNTAVAVRASVR